MFKTLEEKKKVLVDHLKKVIEVKEFYSRYTNYENLKYIEEEIQKKLAQVVLEIEKDKK